MVMNIATIGETNVEKKRIRARREKSFRMIPSTAKKRRGSMSISLSMSMPIRMRVWKNTIIIITQEKPINFPRMILDRAIGFESIR